METFTIFIFEEFKLSKAKFRLKLHNLSKAYISLQRKANHKLKPSFKHQIQYKALHAYELAFNALDWTNASGILFSAITWARKIIIDDMSWRQAVTEKYDSLWYGQGICYAKTWNVTSSICTCLYYHMPIRNWKQCAMEE